ncbi:MAG: VanZ family protein [Nevskiales bacterium]
MKPFRYPWLWFLPGLAWAITLCYASLTPVPESTPLPSDKLLHFTAYFILLFLFGSWVSNKRLPLVVVLGAVMGMGLEYLQGLTDYRSFEWADGLANLTGAVAGAGLAATPLGRFFLMIERQIVRQG